MSLLTFDLVNLNRSPVIQALPYAFDMSKKIAVVEWLLLKPRLIAASFRIRLSVVVHPLRNPVWTLGSMLRRSRCHFNLLLIIFSIALQRHEVREIGLYESAFRAGLLGFRMGATIAHFQFFGTYPFLNIKLINCNRVLRFSVFRFFNILLCILSMPMALSGRWKRLLVSSWGLKSELMGSMSVPERFLFISSSYSGFVGILDWSLGGEKWSR